MKISISNAALNWFKTEIGVQKGQHVRFYTQIYGTSPVQDGYALGFAADVTPSHIGISTERDGIVFFIEENEQWFLDRHDLIVDYNEQIDELTFTYEKGAL